MGILRSDPQLEISRPPPAFLAAFQSGCYGGLQQHSLIDQSADDAVGPVIFFQRVPVHATHYLPSLDPADPVFHVDADP